MDIDTAPTTDVVETDAPAAETSDAPAPAATEGPARYKYRRGEEEREASGEELAAMLNDDYEHEFRGPDAKPVKYNWKAIERAVQKDAGAQEAIRRAREYQKSLMAERELGKKDVFGYLQRHLGIADPEAWAREQVANMYREHTELEDLHARDPMAAIEKMRQMERAKLERQSAYERQQREAQESAQRQQAESQRNDQELRGHLKAAGIPQTKHNLARAVGIFVQHRDDMGIRLGLDQVAALLQKELLQEALGLFDGQADPLKFLGDKRRSKLRDLEVAALKAAKKEEKKAAPPPPKTTPSRKDEEMDIDSLKVRKFF